MISDDDFGYGNEIVNDIDKVNSLYVHIPFCRNICYYCDFCKMYYHKKWVMDYLKELEQELLSYKANRPFETVFIGGGSPSVLDENELGYLLDILKEPLSNCLEATMEVNPEDLTKRKVELMKKSNINRVSLGVQTFHDGHLKQIGRAHTFKTIQDAYHLLLDGGITNISFDFIYGLPNQSLEDLRDDLEKLSYFKELKHLSFYSLILEEHTILYNENIKLKEDEWLIEAGNIIEESLEQLGYQRYEVSNYSKEGYQSMHNKVYWHNQHYIGIGLGSSGYIGNIRYDNTRSISSYLDHHHILNQTQLSLEDRMFEHLMVGLRLVEGVNLEEFNQRYQRDVIAVFTKLKDYIQNGFLVIEDGYLKTTRTSMNLLDELLVGLMN